MYVIHERCVTGVYTNDDMVRVPLVFLSVQMSSLYRARPSLNLMEA